MKHTFRRLRCSFILAVFANLVICGSGFSESTYRVVNVAEGDSLNVRAESNQKSKIIAAIPYNGKDIQVVSLSGSWYKIKIDDQIGWVNSKYLQKEDELKFTEKILCFGNEPFWKMAAPGNEIVLNNPEDTNRKYKITKVQQSSNNNNQWYIFAESTTGTGINIFIIRQGCSDDMSDTDYKYSITIYDSEKDMTINGCCNKLTAKKP